MRLLPLLLLGLFPALAQTLQAPEGLAGPPGEYLTLGVLLEGQGSYTLALEAPPEVLVLSGERALVLEGEGRTSFTFRVPFLEAGREVSLALVLRQGEKEVARRPVRLRVLERTEVLLTAPPDLVASLGAPFEFPVYVLNRSNHPVEVQLSQTSFAFTVYLDPPRLALAPGETRAVLVRLKPEGEVSEGYRFYLRLRAQVVGKEEAKELGLIIPFFSPGYQALGRGKDPRLLLSLALSGGVGYATGQGFGYSVRLTPGLSGDFSDFVSGSLSTDSLRFPGLAAPASATLTLKGEGWEARAGYSGSAYLAGGSFRVGTFRLGLEGQYAPQTAGAALSAVSQDPALDLQLGARTAFQPTLRQDAFSVRYRLPLEGGLLLGLGLDAAGVALEGYQATLALSQSLTWQTQELSLVQTYSGVPLAGLHTFGLVGGTRSLYPLGLRGSLSYALGGEGGFQAGLTLYGQPEAGVLLSLSGLYRQGAQRQAGLSPAATLSFRTPGEYAGSLSFSLGRFWDLDTGAVRDRAQASLGLSLGLLQFSGGLLYETEAWSASAQVRYPLSTLGALRGLYTLKGGVATYEAGWTELWEGGWGTDLFYRYQEGVQRFGLLLGQRNFLLSGLGLGVSYGLTLGPEAVHSVGVSLSYTLFQVFDTPKEVVDLFGGRKVGEVVGRVFLDKNLNGRLDPGEEALSGFRVCLNATCEPVRPDGTYRLLVPVGRAVFRFPDAPATLALLGEESLEVALNQKVERDLALAPAVQAVVQVFEDTNRNGLQDPDEPSIPYAGVLVEGPVVRRTRADVNGRALVGGLFQGVYRVRPDPAFLPPGYEGLGEARLEVAPPDRPAPVQVAAAPPKREVEVTYAAGELAVVARAQPAQEVAGGEVKVVALVEGEPEAVFLELGEERRPLAQEAPGVYALTFRTPRAPGIQRLKVVAVKGGSSAEGEVFLTLLPGLLYAPSRLEGPEVSLTLKYKTAQLALRVNGALYPLNSEDGYVWRGKLPLPPGQYEAQVLADGETLGSLAVDLPQEQAGH
jgi:hypothetical protein